MSARRGSPIRRTPKVKTLPADIRAELDRRLVAGNFRDYSGLARWLSDQGFEIGKAGAWRYSSQLERKLQAVKLATVQAREVIAASPDDDDRINEALIRLVQQHLFEVLVELKSDRLNGANVAAVARCVAEIAKTALMQKKAAEAMRQTVREKLGAAEQKVVGAARDAAGEKGLTPEAEAQIRRALTEIAE